MKKILSAFLSFCLIISCFVGFSLTTGALDAVKYLDVDENDHLCTSYNTLDSTSTAWSSSSKNGWYVASGNVTISDRVTVTGSVKLILKDGASLSIPKGITVANDDRLIIYAQSTAASTMGALTIDSVDNNNNAGIGGGEGQNAGFITINGGKITVTGGTYATGIGGGAGAVNRGAAGVIEINGGIVSATGGCGIGAYQGYTHSATPFNNSITINGGIVEARCHIAGISISTGSTSRGGISILGGQVTASADNPAMSFSMGALTTTDTNIAFYWTNADDFIDAKAGYNGTVTFTKPFVLSDSTTTAATTSNINGKKIVPDLSDYCVVSFDKNGGTGTMTDQIVPKNTATALNECIFTAPENGEFLGWGTSASGAKVYDDCAEITLTSNTNLYAKWKTPPQVINYPTAKSLTYTGKPQELVNAGKAAGGTAVYSMNESGPFSEDIPTGTLVKTYTVYYKFLGEDGYFDSEVGSCTTAIAIAAQPENKPQSTMNVSYSCAKVSDVELPTGWEWDENDKDKQIGAGGFVNVTANYTAEDKDCYTTITATVTINRTPWSISCTPSNARIIGEGTIAFEAVRNPEYTGSDNITYYWEIIEGIYTVMPTVSSSDTASTFEVTKNYANGTATIKLTVTEGTAVYTATQDVKAEDAWDIFLSPGTTSDINNEIYIKGLTVSEVALPETIADINALISKYNTSVSPWTAPDDKIFVGWVDANGETITSAVPPASSFRFVDVTAVWKDKSSGSGKTPSRPTGGSSTSTTTTANEPKIEGGNGASGWSNIASEIGKTKEGGSVTVDMSGVTTVPAAVLEAVKGKDVDVVLDMGGGITWTINGNDITNIKGAIDLGVKLGSSGIPAEVTNNVTGEKYSTTLHLNHSGAFGFKAVMTVPLRKQDAGLFANLFYYNPNRKALEFVSSAQIDENGNAELDFNHASDYAIVIDNHPLDARTINASVDGSSVKLTWDAVSGATSYTVYTAKDGKWSKLKTTSKTELNINKLKNNKTYKFLVRAKVDGKLTPKDQSYKLTVKVCYKPVLKATAKNGAVTLKWSEVNNATKYRVVKSVNGEWKKVKTTSKTSLKISDVKSGNKYKYAVQAYVNGKWTTIGTASTATVKAK